MNEKGSKGHLYRTGPHIFKSGEDFSKYTATLHAPVRQIG